ncbi:hypothetical protein DMC47_34530 [Nostoc sp. 3335mG]|nr:hypothetical protein DMC47_34530 [Nostoc sp. 3335mG]
MAGLTCTASTGAMIRLNVDLTTGRFQKEGFAARPILEVHPNRLILLKVATRAMMIEATLDRLTMVYTAQSEDRISKVVSRSQYQCVAGNPFQVSEN